MYPELVMMRNRDLSLATARAVSIASIGSSLWEHGIFDAVLWPCPVDIERPYIEKRKRQRGDIAAEPLSTLRQSMSNGLGQVLRRTFMPYALHLVSVLGRFQCNYFTFFHRRT